MQIFIVQLHHYKLHTFCYFNILFQYKEAQKNLSVGTLTQHFSLPENIQLSKYSVDFLRTVKETLNQNCDLQYTPTGSLVLASEKYADKLEENNIMLNELGVKSKLVTTSEINKKYPWINTQDIKLGKRIVIVKYSRKLINHSTEV